MGSDESLFNVSLIVRDKVSVHKPQRLKRRESPCEVEPRSFCLPAWRLTARPDRLTAEISEKTLLYYHAYAEVCFRQRRENPTDTLSNYHLHSKQDCGRHWPCQPASLFYTPAPSPPPSLLHAPSHSPPPPTFPRLRHEIRIVHLDLELLKWIIFFPFFLYEMTINDSRDNRRFLQTLDWQNQFTVPAPLLLVKWIQLFNAELLPHHKKKTTSLQLIDKPIREHTSIVVKWNQNRNISLRRWGLAWFLI